MPKLKRWSQDELRQLPAKDLAALYARCQELSGAPEADEASTLIETIGIPCSREGTKLDSLFGRKMQAGVFSPESKVAALDAASRGLAPMTVIDPMLQSALGDEYKNAYEGTVAAGYLVANLMRQNQWDVDRKRRAELPDHCVAKTAALYVHIPSKKS
jgi:hypothetical protein